MNIFPINIRVIALVALAALISKIFWKPDIPWSCVIGCFVLDAVIGLRLVLDW